MKKFFSRQLLTLLIAPALFLSFKSMPHRPDFSGDWKLNEGKSELGDFGGRFAAIAIKVEQKEDAITIAKTTPGFNGGDPVTTNQTLTFDGKEAESTVFGGAKRKSTAKWSDDGHTFTISSTTLMERDGQTNEIKGTETWTLTKEGALSIVTVSSSPRGEINIKAIYNK
jgi:hypothetical protein